MQAKLPGGNGHLSPNLHINEIAYLGAHNSPMSKCYGWKYTQQNVSITEQFEKHGARHFKFPLHWHLEKGVPQIVIAHEGDGGSNCKLSVLQRLFTDPESACHRLKELFNLAYKYPNEIMIIKIESKLMEHTKENGTLGWNESDDDLKLHNLLVELNAPQRAITFQDNNPPTLGWCRENQKNILITIEPRRQIGDFLFKYTHYSYDISGQVNYNLDPLEDVKNGDLLNGKIWNPFLEIHLYSENALKQKLKQKLPFVTDKYNDYSHVKKRFKQFNTHCNKMPNFVLADYVDQGNPSKTIDEANDIINKHGCFKPELL